MSALTHWFQPDPALERSPSGGRTTLEGEGALAALVGFESPLHSGRSVVALTANDSAAMERVSAGLNDSGKIQQMRGDLVLLRAETIDSFRINPIYYVGSLPWWQWLWFHLHSHPLLLALVGIGTGLLLTFIVYAALRSMARRPLAARND